MNRSIHDCPSPSIARRRGPGAKTQRRSLALARRPVASAEAKRGDTQTAGSASPARARCPRRRRPDSPPSAGRQLPLPSLCPRTTPGRQTRCSSSPLGPSGHAPHPPPRAPLPGARDGAAAGGAGRRVGRAAARLARGAGGALQRGPADRVGARHRGRRDAAEEAGPPPRGPGVRRRLPHQDGLRHAAPAAGAARRAVAPRQAGPRGPRLPRRRRLDGCQRHRRAAAGRRGAQRRRHGHGHEDRRRVQGPPALRQVQEAAGGRGGRRRAPGPRARPDVRLGARRAQGQPGQSPRGPPLPSGDGGDADGDDSSSWAWSSRTGGCRARSGT